MYKLSICIPVYNREFFLDALLKNIFGELSKYDLLNDVEICISDNASIDRIGNVTQKYKAKYDNIVYHKNEKNLGADRNFLKCIEIAHGEFCWLFGSDDRFHDGSIKRVLNYLDEDKELSGIVVSSQAYINDFTEKLEIDPLSPKYIRKYSIPNEFLSNHGYHFCFISAHIFKRELWNRVTETYDLTDYFNVYVHVFVLIKLAFMAQKYLYVGDRLISFRADNDSFLSTDNEGYIKRYRIEYELERIARHTIGKNTSVYRQYMKKVCWKFVFTRLLDIKLATSVNMFSLFFEILSKYWKYPAFYFKILPLFLLPKKGVRILENIKAKCRKLRILPS